MNAFEVRGALQRETRRRWPGASRSKELPFGDYWRNAAEWLIFHAPHIGDKLMGELICEVADTAYKAYRGGFAPEPYKVSDEIRAIWAKAAKSEAQDAWDHAAERAAAVNSRMRQKMLKTMKQEVFL